MATLLKIDYEYFLRLSIVAPLIGKDSIIITTADSLIKTSKRYTTWPDDALLRVAENFIRSMNLEIDPEKAASTDIVDPVEPVPVPLDEDDVVEEKLSPLERSLVEMVMQFNTSIVEASAR